MCAWDKHIWQSGYRRLKSLWVVLPCIVLMLSSCSGKYQNETIASTPEADSLKERALTLSQSGKHQAAIYFYDSAYHELNNPTALDKYRYYYFRADVGRYLQESEEEVYLDSALLFLENNDLTKSLPKEYSESIFAKADLLLERGQEKQAYEYYYKGKAIAEEQGDSCILSNYNYRIAMAMYRAEKYNAAIAEYKEAFANSQPCRDELVSFHRAQEILDNVGLCYHKLAMYDSALYYYNKAIVFIDGGYQFFPEERHWLMNAAKAVVYGNMGSTYVQKEDYDKAEEHFNKSLKITEERWYNLRDAQFTRIKLAEIYLRQGRASEAENILEQVGHINDSVADSEVALRRANLMWQHYRYTDPDKAKEYLALYVKLKDSLAFARRNNLYIDIDEQVSGLEQADKIYHLREQNRLRAFYLAVAVFVVFLLMIIALLVRYNMKRSRKNIRLLKRMNNRIAMQKDKTEKALQLLEKSDKEKDRILRAVSHDMRSPMNSALGLIDVLENTEIHEEHKEYIELIKNSCSNALMFTKDLQAAASIADEPLQKNEVDIYELLRNNIELLKFRAAGKMQTIEFTAKHVMPIHAAAEKITRVINNIITNAIKFSPQHTTIFVTLEQEKGGILISVRDQGIGIPEAMKHKVFDILTEAKRFGTSGEEPYGLGLSISKQIVEAHGGKIWFESGTEGGTTFFISLPE